jgi:hypothetical protein
MTEVALCTIEGITGHTAIGIECICRRGLCMRLLRPQALAFFSHPFLSVRKAGKKRKRDLKRKESI